MSELRNGGFPGPGVNDAPPTGLKDYKREPAEEAPVEAAPESEPDVDIEVTEEEPEDEAIGEPEAEEPEEEAGEPVTVSRAERRIRELVATNKDLKDALAVLAEGQTKLTQEQARRESEQAAFLAQQRQANEPRNRAQEMQSAGLDPAQGKDQALYELFVRDQAKDRKISELAAMVQELAGERTQAKQINTLDGVLTKELSRYDVKPETLAVVRSIAQDIAKAQGLTPDAAAKAAVARMAGLLRPKAVKKGQPAAEAMHVVNATGRTGGRSAVQSQTNNKSFSDFLKDFGAAPSRARR